MAILTWTKPCTKERRLPRGCCATRRRKVIVTVALFLGPFMAVGPETVLALNQKALLYHAGFGAAIGQTSTGITVIDNARDANGYEPDVQSQAKSGRRVWIGLPQVSFRASRRYGPR